MEEILELKQLLLKGDIKNALIIAEELEEMSQKDIINNIYSFAVILLLHLIKQQAENRTTRSWDISIKNSILDIHRLNKRPKSKGFYLDADELYATLVEAYPKALNQASLEVCEGIYEPRHLETMVNQNDIIEQAFTLIIPTKTDEELNDEKFYY